MKYEVHLSKSMSPQGKEDTKKMSMVLYASAVGSLMYTILCTRPNISYAVTVVSRFRASLVKCILKYLRSTNDMLLVYGNGELRVDGYTNSYF